MNRFLPAASLAALLLAATPALAHVELEKNTAPAGGDFKLVFMVPHGCAGSATVGLRVKIPDGVIKAKPMPKAGWTLRWPREFHASSSEVPLASTGRPD